ncbi:YciI family protein [Hufsiella ginkgonis]|uniref:YCII-related domain-containing protein n=1 Tax=Hufsiella ginkgonis TaxID=2695274 RepID=A0A7K1XX34_9SPHI|nr:YciI family protein [Hufsiella ginkgonis]MXV15397.1 hypothetical protein [Hufsiella ginkgonis]
MNQYLITAYDFTDEQALDRRMAVRPDHLEGARTLKSKNQFVLGGAMLNDDGKMVGSTMMVQFETPADLDEWLANEPYILRKVWDKVTVTSFRVANV